MSGITASQSGFDQARAIFSQPYWFDQRSDVPIQRVNMDFTAGMLEEVDKAAQQLNVSRQAVINMLVQQALNQHHLAQRARRA